MILNPVPFVAEWSGGNDISAVSVEPLTRAETEVGAISHFGHGILTFSIKCLFRTSPGYDLYVTGPINSVKDAIQPLTGIVETDWTPATFTMNWRFTRSSAPVFFFEGDPICMFFPVKRGLLEEVLPEVRPITDDPELAEEYLLWEGSREQFIKELKIPGSRARRQKWQKEYFQGKIRSRQAPESHKVKLFLKEFY
jgi:hypothetical protein